jgi:2,3-dihydroxybiphenyl 1,2-dioxygenase
MHHQLELAYLGIEVPDPSALTPFFGDVIGLVPGEPGSPGAMTWRDDDKAHRLIIQPGPANDAVYMGFEAADPGAFDDIAGRLRAAGYDVTEADSRDRAERRVARLARTMAPWSMDIELVQRLEDARTQFSSPLVPGGFLTRGLGFGHAVFATTAFEDSRTFLDALGFVQSDWLETEIATGIELEVHFYHCNARHHTIALAKAPFELPQKLHHVMFEMNERGDVGAAFDRAWATDLPIPNGLGMHDNDRMFSFYVASPAGFLVEVGHGARTITDDWKDDRRYERISAWGHQALRP